MKRFHLVLPLFLLAMPLPAIAFDNPELLKDYIGLTKLLKANGVEPSRVNWQPIEMMCMGLKEPRSNLAYNQCRLEKSIDQAVYANDSDACNAEARAAYPTSLRHPNVATMVNSTSGDKNKTTVSTLTPARTSTAEIRDGRRSLFDRCMLDRGWVNTGTWQMGRKD